MEKSGSKYASGSNFNLIKLECGVELTENKRKKSGGKNYFEKYGRFSYELFQNRLNKTTQDNFVTIELNEKINNSMKQENNLIDIRKSNKKDEIFSNKELNRQKSDFDAKFEIINTSNDFLNPKTKNLKIVMQNLELMKDFEFNIESENNDTPQSKYNFL